MTTSLHLTLPVLAGLISCTPAAHADPAKAAPPAASADAPSGHYCNLGVFTREEHERHRALVVKFRAAVSASHELANGYSFDFGGQFKEAGEWIDGVRRCCPTVDYHVDFAARGGPAVLRITGGDGAKDFIREEFKPLFKAPS
ncbi:MAG TPA: hypothetical protein VIX73_36835 [Kofleriaceae bacterium]|jgi:hypothetical protein